MCAAPMLFTEFGPLVTNCCHQWAAVCIDTRFECYTSAILVIIAEIFQDFRSKMKPRLHGTVGGSHVLDQKFHVCVCNTR